MRNDDLKKYINFLRLKAKIKKKFSAFRGNTHIKDMSEFIPMYKKIWQEAAEKVSAEFFQIDQGIWKVVYDNRMTVINNYKVELDNPVILDLAGQRSLCFRLLQEKGLPVPDHLLFKYDDLEKVKEFLKQLGENYFVIKPANGTSGARGISTHIRTLRECWSAIALASTYGEEVIIEKFIAGESYRLLVLDGKVIHVSRRRGNWIKCDGKSTIAQLIKKTDTFSHHDPTKNDLLSIKFNDRDMTAQLKFQGLTLNSIPDAQQGVIVKSNPIANEKFLEFRTVFNEDATGMVSKDLCDQAVRAARVLNSKFAGVDIITIDPKMPLEESGGVINEINTTPGLHHHYNLQNDQGLSSAVPVLKYLLNIPENI